MSGKQISILISTVLMCCSIVGCGSTNSDGESSSANSSIAEESVDDNTAPVQCVEYISERSVQYNEQDDVYQVMFALSDSSENYIDASGTASIEITDVQGNIIYNKDIKFTKKDFTSWTNSMRDQSSYGCWLEIPRNEVEGASSSSGTLSLKVYGDDFSFDESNLNIYDLPQKEASIILPDTPISITDMRYSSHTSYATVSDISYEAENNYDGEMTLTLKLVVSLDSKSGEENVADSVAIGYRLMDSEGFIAASGTIYTDDLRVGEKIKEDENIYDLDPSETYTLTLENVT